MMRYFNTTGFCRPDLHYMVDPLRGLEGQIYKLIKQEQYFLLHAPRQSGKTTLLHSLAKKLNEENQYVCVVFSVESAGYKSISDKEANDKIIYSIYNSAELQLKTEYFPGDFKEYTGASMERYLSDWSQKISKPIVLLIDEIDSLYDDILVSILRQLRNGFQKRPKGFPCSIALVGLRDLRDYKLKVRQEEHSLGSGSPFNINAKSFMLGSFLKEQIKELYNQHTIDTGQVFNDEVVDLVYDSTGGQPWLVNAIANEIISEILKNDYTKEILPEIVLQAKENLILRRDTHLDSLVEKLKEDRVKRIIVPLLNGEIVLADTFNDDLQYCLDLGLLIKEKNNIKFANKIYAEVIPRVLNYQLQSNIREEGEIQWYIFKNGLLDMNKLLKSFQQFYRENSEHWIDRFYYKEAGQQLLLMAFLQRVINSGGRIEREMAIARGRTDLVVFFNTQRFVIEMKLKHTGNAKEKGLVQLYNYLDSLGEEKGYLVLFETHTSKEISWEERINWEEIEFNQESKGAKKITIVEL